jgi:hypothetical protein
VFAHDAASGRRREVDQCGVAMADEGELAELLDGLSSRLYGGHPRSVHRRITASTPGRTPGDLDNLSTDELWEGAALLGSAGR